MSLGSLQVQVVYQRRGAALLHIQELELFCRDCFQRPQPVIYEAMLDTMGPLGQPRWQKLGELSVLLAAPAPDPLALEPVLIEARPAAPPRLPALSRCLGWRSSGRTTSTTRKLKGCGAWGRV